MRHHLQCLCSQAKDDTKCDLGRCNLEVMKELLQASECFSEAKELETNYNANRKLLPKDVAEAYWRADHHYQRAKLITLKYQELFPEFVLEFYHSQFHQTLANLRHNQLMVRHLELYLTDEPELFGQILGYSAAAVKTLKGLRARDYT